MNDNNYTIERPKSLMAGRTRRVYKWLEHDKDILDAGCSSGYGTYYFAKKSAHTSAIDPNEKDINKAREEHDGIEFTHGFLEDLPYSDGSFDTVVMADVLEHVKDEVKVLSEIHRVLRNDGSVILTVPYTGLLSLFDPENYTVFFRKKAPRLYRRLYLLVKKKEPKPVEVGMESWHRHYSYNTVIGFLDNSDFVGGYTVEKKRRTGVLFMPLASNVRYFSNFLLPKKIALLIQWPFTWLSRFEYYIPTGSLAWSMALKVRKK